MLLQVSRVIACKIEQKMKIASKQEVLFYFIECKKVKVKFTSRSRLVKQCGTHFWKLLSITEYDLEIEVCQISQQDVHEI